MTIQKVLMMALTILFLGSVAEAKGSGTFGKHGKSSYTIDKNKNGRVRYQFYTPNGGYVKIKGRRPAQ